MICGFVENHGHPMLLSLQIIAMLTWKEMPSVENLQIVCWVNQWLSNFFSVRRTKKITKTFAAHLLPNKIALKNSCVGCDCFREQIRLKWGSVVAKHTHILLSIPRSLSFFAFIFCQSRKSIFTEPWICQFPGLFWFLCTDHWIGFVSRWPSLVQAVLGKQCMKKRVVSYVSELHGRSQNFFQGGTISTVCLLFCWLMDVQ